MHPRAKSIRSVPCAQHAKGNFRRGEVRLCLLDDAAQGFKCLAMPIHDGAHAGVKGHTAQVLEPGNADAFKAAVEGARQVFPWFIDRKWRAGIWSSNRAQHE